MKKFRADGSDGANSRDAPKTSTTWVWARCLSRKYQWDIKNLVDALTSTHWPSDDITSKPRSFRPFPESYCVACQLNKPQLCVYV